MKYLLFVLCAVSFPLSSLLQCAGFPATVAESSCGTGSALASGANINSGVYSFCGTTSSTTTFSSINLSGGTINICGNVTISSGNWNSGTIVVSCGSTLTFSSSLTLNSNIKIVNYGRVNINGDLTFQNNGNCFYNETSHSSLYVTGNIVWPQNTGDYSYLKNYGYVSIGGTFNARNGVYVCSGDGSIISTTDFTYGTGCGAPSNRFTYDGSTGTSIFRYTGTALLRGTVTASANYAVNKATAATVTATCGSWGSAVVATNSPSYTVPSSLGPCTTNPVGCYTVLPITLVSFDAELKGRTVHLSWKTESEHNNHFFTVQRSQNGTDWEPISYTESKGNDNGGNSYEYDDTDPLGGISYYRLSQTDYDGSESYYQIRSVVLKTQSGAGIYPNPASSVVMVDFDTSLPVSSVVLYDASGRLLPIGITELNSSLKIDLTGIPSGTYLLQLTHTDGSSYVERLVVQ